MPNPSTNPSRLEHVQENFVRHILPLRGFVHGLVPRRHLADDIVQETFLIACQRADTYEPGTNFRAWIFTIARFRALKVITRESNHARLLNSEIIELLADEALPDHQLQERVTALENCVAKLSPTSRRAVSLRYTENLGPTEIARQLGWSINALNVALSRTRNALRRCVEEVQSNAKSC